MSQPGTNLIVKIAVPVVLTAAIVVGVKSCSDSKEKTASTQKTTNAALKDLSPDDLKALGVEGDTPQDTLRTIVGNFRRVQDRLDTLANDNKKLNEENTELKKTNSNVDAQINEAVANARADEADKRAKLSAQVSDLSSQVGQMLEQLKTKMPQRLTKAAHPAATFRLVWAMTTAPVAASRCQPLPQTVCSGSNPKTVSRWMPAASP